MTTLTDPAIPGQSLLTVPARPISPPPPRLCRQRAPGPARRNLTPLRLSRQRALDPARRDLPPPLRLSRQRASGPARRDPRADPRIPRPCKILVPVRRAGQGRAGKGGGESRAHAWRRHRVHCRRLRTGSLLTPRTLEYPLPVKIIRPFQ